MKLLRRFPWLTSHYRSPRRRRRIFKSPRRFLHCEPLEDRRLLAITVDTLVDEADGSIVDGDIDFDDTGALVLGLTGPDDYEVLYGAPPNANGDMDGDGDQDFDDIPLFVAMLGGQSDPVLGDLDLDEDVDFDDIDDFALGLTEAGEYEAIYGVSPTEAGDIDQDGDFDFDDIPGFGDLLTPGLAATTSSIERVSFDMTVIEHDRADVEFSTETGSKGSGGDNLLRPTRLPLDRFARKGTNGSDLRSDSATSSRDRELRDDELASIWSGDIDWLRSADHDPFG